MAGPTSFWQRMTHLFRSETAAVGAAAPPVLEPPPEATGTAGPVHMGDDRAGAVWWRPVRRPPAGELSTRVIELVESMQQHFRQQDQRAAEMTGALDRVGGILEQLADTQRTQGETLRAIEEHSESAGRNAAALTSTLSRVPDSLLAQAEAIRTVARQLDLAQEADNQLMHSLQQFGRAIDTLGSSGTAQVEILQRLNAAQQLQHEAVAALVRDQGRRFLVVVIITGVLALAALAALIVTLALRWAGA